MTNAPNVNIRIFQKRWSLILGCFLPVSILKDFEKILKFTQMKLSQSFNDKHTCPSAASM